MKVSLLQWLYAAAFVAMASAASIPNEASVRDNNGGNCIGVKSCRPRCITFRVDRDEQDCASSKGIFTVESNLNPWDVSEFEAFNCDAGITDLSQDVTIRIGEFGASGSKYYSSIFLPQDGDERFTYCSVYPCPKDECAVPEQMGTRLQFDFLQGVVGLDEPADYLLRLELELTQQFNGPPVQETGANRFGPLHVEWMDDPTGCRPGDFSSYAPVRPENNPTILTNTTLLPQSSFCSGSAYDPTPLPGTRPPTPPTSMPSSSPTTPPQPTELSAVQISQLDALELFYQSTRMNLPESASRHDWFENLDYCNWTGITCGIGGHVKFIELVAKRLSGFIPTEIGNLERLQHLKLTNNDIGGEIPSQLAQLVNLTHVVLGSNEFVGEIPSELGSLAYLKRLLVQNNRLEGTIPDSLCNPQESFVSFDISGNVDMHGEIPECFGSLTALESLLVSDVGLVGTVPNELCDVRPMNGLAPNLYGCWAIACPAGYYEPTYGREVSDSEYCIPCDRIQSNVIGSTTCMLVDGNEVLTMVPTVSPAPTMEPSASPSALPSSVPTAGPIDTTPSQAPSMGPSSPPVIDPITDKPSFLPSSFPSSLPSLAPSESPTLSDPSVLLTAFFQDVSTVMEGEDIETFETATLEYLNANGDPYVSQVQVISQSLRPPTDNEPLVSVLSSRRRLEDEALFVQMQVGGDGTVRSDLQDKVVASLENSTAYTAALSQALPVFNTTASLPPDTIIVTPVNPANNGRAINWALLGSALGLSVLAVATVIMVRRVRKRTIVDAAAEPTNAIPQPEDHAVVNPTNNRNNNRNSHMYDVSLSEESSGGWVSEESEDDFVNAAPSESGASIAGWSMSQNDVYLTSQPSQQSMV